jgi:hypothetical protein
LIQQIAPKLFKAQKASSTFSGAGGFLLTINQWLGSFPQLGYSKASDTDYKLI